MLRSADAPKRIAQEALAKATGKAMKFKTGEWGLAIHSQGGAAIPAACKRGGRAQSCHVRSGCAAHAGKVWGGDSFRDRPQGTRIDDDSVW